MEVRGDMQDFIQQVVKEVVAGVRDLDPVRRRMFLVWLGNHASQLSGHEEGTELECLAEELGAWFDTMSLVSILWEYRLLMSEIEWWRVLEGAVLDRHVGVKA